MMNLNFRIKRRAGFTMVELMIVVVLVGIVTTMAAPGLQKSYERMKYRAAVRNVTSSLRLARSTAIATKEQVGIAIDTEKKLLTIFADRVNPDNYQLENGDSTIRVDTLPLEIVWVGTDCTNNVIAFEPNGSSGFVGGGNIYSLAYTPKMIGFHVSNVLASTGRVATDFQFY